MVHEEGIKMKGKNPFLLAFELGWEVGAPVPDAVTAIVSVIFQEAAESAF